jgi:hypothetical protein
VSSLRVCRGELVVTGNFSTVGGYASPKMARFVMAGDADGDGLVDVVDLLYMVAAFGSVKGDAQYDPRCDTSLDGAVDVVDLLAMVDNWGESVLD